MKRPMKLAGQQLMFGQGCLAHLKTLDTKRAIIVTGGSRTFAAWRTRRGRIMCPSASA